jgi:hypothetical protein
VHSPQLLTAGDVGLYSHVRSTVNNRRTCSSHRYPSPRSTPRCPQLCSQSSIWLPKTIRTHWYGQLRDAFRHKHHIRKSGQIWCEPQCLYMIEALRRLARHGRPDVETLLPLTSTAPCVVWRRQRRRRGQARDRDKDMRSLAAREMGLR